MPSDPFPDDKIDHWSSTLNRHIECPVITVISSDVFFKAGQSLLAGPMEPSTSIGQRSARVTSYLIFPDTVATSSRQPFQQAKVCGKETKTSL